ncbi:MAG: T9SS type A sorting domain-containing protein [Bacteroidetes bacterium]|nr:T9SS type A sorting domain-containing protein [Bacteroidota bacterium]
MVLLKIKHIILITICALSLLRLSAQTSFVTKFNSPVDEYIGPFIQNADGEFIGVIARRNSTISYSIGSLYKISGTGDTIFSKQFQKPDTLMEISTLIQSNENPIEYLVYGSGFDTTDTPYRLFNYFIKLDNDFNKIWEKKYILRPEGVTSLNELWRHVIRKKDGGYFFASNFDKPGDERLVLFELSEEGDSLAYRVYEDDSAGFTLMSISYNYDSTAYQLYTWGAHYIPYEGMAQCITVDFNLNQTDVKHYPRHFDDGLTGKILPDGNLITGGLYQNSNLPPAEASNMAVLKHDTSFNLLAECYVGDPDYDIRKDNGFRSMDFYYPNSIFVAGTFDFTTNNWPQRPSWIVLGKMDSDLNLLTEKYLGGDAYYHFNTITATSDGGALITTLRYDYLTQYHEHDAYIIKLDSMDLTVGITERKEKKLVDAIVYPNPTCDLINIRTAIKNAVFELYDLSGKKLISKPLTNLITPIKLENIVEGTYIWSVIQQNKLIETGKIIKTNNN